MSKQNVGKKFPLFQHQSGQWAKKVRGRMLYFGVDRKAALAKWEHDSFWLLRGLTPPGENEADAPDLSHLCNTFLTSKKMLVDSGELSPRTWSSYYTCCEQMIDFFGGKRLLTDLKPDDFISFRAKLAESNGPVGLSNSVQRVRTVLHFAADVMDIPIRYGRKSFTKVKAHVMRAERHRRGERMIEPEEIRRMIGAAKQPLRTMLLLAINCAYGQSDLAGLPIDAIDGDWINFPRPKTGMPRRCWLWPETRAAISDWLKRRPTPKDAADSGLLFITKYGQRFVRTRKSKSGKVTAIDGISQEFRKLVRSLEIETVGGVYTLRHVHRTVADGTKDQPACDFIMGHANTDMASKYRERIDDSRLLAVAQHLRKWLGEIK